MKKITMIKSRKGKNAKVLKPVLNEIIYTRTIAAAGVVCTSMLAYFSACLTQTHTHTHSLSLSFNSPG